MIGMDTMQSTLKKRTFDFVDASYDDQDATKYFNIVMLVLIFLNIVAAILETEVSIYSRYKNIFDAFEVVSVGIFTVEYILRLWSSTENPKYRDHISGRVRFALTPAMLIDLASFLPFYIPFLGMDLRMIRVLRLFRLFRLLKMGRYSRALSTIQRVINSKKEELGLTIFSGAVLLILASSILYIIEHDAQPDTFSSIPDAMWWGAVTLTTVGYGDVYPVTGLGKIVGALIAVLGIGLFALPAGIIASGFASELQSKQTEARVCPHCGKLIDQT
jgi:voltage-gated potassium channel